MGRRQPPMRAGDHVIGPNGVDVVLPKDWADLTITDLTALGLGPGQPPGSTVSGFIPTTDLPLRWRPRAWARRPRRRTDQT